MTIPTAFAEIIESSLSVWRGQCWQWETMPAYGSLLTCTTAERTTFGLVYEIQTGSIDSNRTIFTYKKSDEELKRDHPHIFEFLQTSFSCLTLGYEENGVLYYALTPEPPKIHAFVQQATLQQYESFFAHPHYLHTLFSFAHTLTSLDELLLATLKHISDAKLLTEERLVDFIEAFSLHTANDYRRLKLFLQRAHMLLQGNPSFKQHYLSPYT